MSLRIGSLFTGTGALDLAVMDVYDAEVVWHSQYEPPDKNGKEDKNQYAAKILARHWPETPNLGDITKVDWQAVIEEHGPIDILTGGFPCFPAGTLITTSTGLVPIEQVKEGDEVLTHARRWKPVVQTMSRRAGHRVAVKAMGAPTITTTDEHPFYIRRTRDSVAAEWVKAAELKPGMYAAQHIDEPSNGDVSQHDLAVAYLVGRWLGDGWTVTHKRTSKVPQGSRGSRINSMARRVHWCCSPSEAGELEAAFAAAGIRPTRSDERTVVKYVIQSVEWAERLAPYGQYAHGKQIPESAHRLPRAVQAEILRGWLDSDGDVKADGTLNGTTTSRALAVGMARIARCVYGKAVSIHENRPPSSTQIEGRSVNQRPWWNVRVSPGPSKRAFVADGFAWVPVRSVAREETGQDVFNIGVQDDESYIAEGVVVHNCQDVSSAGRRAGMTPDSRSGLWAHMAHAVSVLQPKLVVIENVEGLLSAPAASDLEPCPWCVGDGHDGPVLRALGAVLGDLATLGLDAEWGRFEASDIGAPHRRRRIIIRAWPAAEDSDSAACREWRIAASGQEDSRGARSHLGGRGRASAADAGHGRAGEERQGPDVVVGERPARRGRPVELAGADRSGEAGFRAAAGSSSRGGESAADEPGDRREAAPHADGRGCEGHQERNGRPEDGQPEREPGLDAVGRGVRRAAVEPACPEGTPADADGTLGGLDVPRRRSGPVQGPEVDERAAQQPGRLHRGSRAEVAVDLRLRPGPADLDWGPYESAIRRWERILGRPAPWPTDLLGRLSPVFSEWMMGLPEGWVTATPGVTKAAMHKALGNGVVRQQAAHALQILHARSIDDAGESAA